MTTGAEYSARWRMRHPERYKASYTKQNRQFGKQRDAEFRRRQLLKNPRFYADNAAIWRKANPKQYNILMARAKRKRYKNSPHHRVKDLVSRSISKAVRKNGCIKTLRTLELLGTDIPTLRVWLESKFQVGMTWSNMGKFGWHIDHVLPCSSFDLSSEEQQRKCFHYTNLQPLWWRDNLSKGDKIL